MKVSFILPAYKRRFLKEAIASILSQTCRDFELVVVDDCSPENLKEVVDEFHDERLTYHRNAENIGGKDLVAAWNHAMEYATGEWCVLASDDDMYLPQFLEEMLRLSKKYPGCDLFHARNADIDSDGKWTNMAFPRVEFESQVEFTYARAVLRLAQRAPDFMFRISALRKLGGFVNFPAAWYSDDATWMLLSKNGCVHSREVLFCFRMSGINLSSYGDATVLAKIEAGNLYEKLLLRTVNDFEPVNDVERRYIEDIRIKGRNQIASLKRDVLVHTKDRTILKRAMRMASFSAAERRSVVYARHPRILALRLLLPRR